MLECGFANVNNSQLYYETIGADDPIVLVHGFSLDTRAWDEQFAVFSQRYKVIRYDMRGFGRSALPTAESYSHAQDLKALVDYLGISHFTLVGHSRGGRLAIEFALKYQECLAKLIIADTVPDGFIPEKDLPLNSNDIMIAARTKGMQAARAAWFDNPLFHSVKSNPQLRNCIWQIIQDYSGWHWVNNDPGLIGAPNAAQRLPEIDTQTLIILGEHDLDIFHKASDLMKSSMQNSTRVMIQGAGHMSPMEDPAVFNYSVQKFLEIK